jgi:tRNA-dihydrouridine synthase
MRDAAGVQTRILGNGDVATLAAARKRVEETGADGVMIGRGIFGTPWLFAEPAEEPPLEEKLRILVEHCRAFEELCTHKPFYVMKKHFKAYVGGFSGASRVRAQLMECNNADEVEACIQK